MQGLTMHCILAMYTPQMTHQLHLLMILLSQTPLWEIPRCYPEQGEEEGQSQTKLTFSSDNVCKKAILRLQYDNMTSLNQQWEETGHQKWTVNCN